MLALAFLRCVRVCVGLATKALSRDFAAAARALPRHLQAIWDDRARGAADRRKLLFALWDECADDENGAAARATIIEFVRARLPRGAADGYTEAELDELNRGRSTDGFGP